MTIEKTAEKLKLEFNDLDDNTDKWVNLLIQLSELDELVPDMIKKVDDEYWIVPALASFLSLALKNKQNKSLSKLISGDFLEFNRLVKINRRVPKKYLDFYNFNYIFLGGVYIDMPAIVVNSRVSNQLIEENDDRGFVENFGLPSRYHYGTRKLTDDGFVVALGYNKVCPEYVKSSSDWEYFELY